MSNTPASGAGRPSTPSSERKEFTHTCPRCKGEFDESLLVCPTDGTNILDALGLSATYEVLERVGSGGMGVIYKARHKSLRKIVALKMIRSQLLTAQSAMRFQVEGRAASQLSSPHIVAVHDLGVTETGQPYLVMEYVEGEPLSKLLDRQKKLPIKQFIHIFSQLCTGLQHAHERGVLHRDIKPSNIMLKSDSDGSYQVVILDFGIAKLVNLDSVEEQRLTETGEAIGSPLYMSPEQCYGRKVDRRSDIYSVGCVMYECLTGSPPFIGRTAFETASMRMNHDALPMASAGSRQLPLATERLVLKCLARLPEERYQTMEELKSDLLLSQPQFSAGQAGKNSRPSYKRFGLAGCVIAIAVGCATWWQFSQVRPVPVTHEKVDALSLRAPVSENIIDVKDRNLKQLVEEQRSSNGDAITLGDLDARPSNEDLSALSRATPALKTLNLEQSPIDDSGLEYLSKLKLKFLSLKKTSVRELRPLAQMDTLEHLMLEGTSVDRNGLKVAVKLPNLKLLDLSRTPIADADLPLLYGSNLNYLSLMSCNLTPSAISKLHNANPDMTIAPSINDVFHLKYPISIGTIPNDLNLLDRTISEIRKQTGEKSQFEADLLYVKGITLKIMHRNAEARECFSEALQICQHLKPSSRFVVKNLLELAGSYDFSPAFANRVDRTKGLEYRKKAQHIMAVAGWPDLIKQQALNQTYIGYDLAILGDTNGLSLINNSIDTYTSSKDYTDLVYSWKLLGEAEFNMTPPRYTDAIYSFKHALQLVENGYETPQRSSILRSTGISLMKVKPPRYSEAEEYLTKLVNSNGSTKEDISLLIKVLRLQRKDPEADILSRRL